MAWWFNRWIDRLVFPSTAKTQEEIARAVQERLAEQARELLNELLTNFRQASRAFPVGIGARLHTTTGRTFVVTEWRIVKPGDFHYCGGDIQYSGLDHSQFFPGQHQCWILVEWHPQAPPPKQPRPPATPADRLARHLRTLGFKKVERPTAEDVRARYLDLAKRYHPDVNPRGIERMKRITEAYRNYQELTKWKTTP